MARRRRVVRHRYARRRGGRRGKSGIPIVQVATLTMPVIKAYEDAGGFNKFFLSGAVYDLTGISIRKEANLPNDYTKGITNAVILLAESTIGRKIANKVGVNKMLRKATGNMFQLM